MAKTFHQWDLKFFFSDQNCFHNNRNLCHEAMGTKKFHVSFSIGHGCQYTDYSKDGILQDCNNLQIKKAESVKLTVG